MVLSPWTVRRHLPRDSRWHDPLDRLPLEVSQRFCGRAAQLRYRGALPRNARKAPLLRPGLETTLAIPTNGSIGECDSNMKAQGKYDYSTFVPPPKDGARI